MYDVSTIDVTRPLLDRAKIATILPHRGTMALLDGIAVLNAAEMLVVGWMDVPADAFWTPGHFPGTPLLPGVLLVEASAQLSLVGYKTVEPSIADRLVVFGGIDDVRFRGAVRPGDRVFLIAKMTETTRRGARCSTQGVVAGRLVYEGEVFAVVT